MIISNDVVKKQTLKECKYNINTIYQKDNPALLPVFVARHYRGPPGSGLTRINKIEKCQETARGQQGGTGLPYK
jgi:hypothetical protein